MVGKLTKAGAYRFGHPEWEGKIVEFYHTHDDFHPEAGIPGIAMDIYLDGDRIGSNMSVKQLSNSVDSGIDLLHYLPE